MEKANLITVTHLDGKLTEFLTPTIRPCDLTIEEIQNMWINKQIKDYEVNTTEFLIPSLIPLTPHRVNFILDGYKIVYPKWSGNAPRISSKNEFIGSVEHIGVLDISLQDDIIGDKPFERDSKSVFVVGLALGSHPKVRAYPNVYTLVTQKETVTESFLTNPKQLWVTLLGRA